MHKRLRLENINNVSGIQKATAGKEKKLLTSSKDIFKAFVCEVFLFLAQLYGGYHFIFMMHVL